MCACAFCTILNFRPYTFPNFANVKIPHIFTSYKFAYIPGLIFTALKKDFLKDRKEKKKIERDLPINCASIKTIAN